MAQAGVACVPRDLPVLGADTIVIITVKCLRNRETLSMQHICCTNVGQTHQVMTAVALSGQQARAGLSGGDGP